MSPTGHLLTSIAACTLSHTLGAPVQMTVGLFLGGFLIDIDHYFDYVIFEGQRSLNPLKFLRYYLECKLRRAFLILHSYELMILFCFLAAFTRNQLLVGYLLGALMHLTLDIYFNGQHRLKAPFYFYSFFYRRQNRFLAHRMINIPPQDAEALKQSGTAAKSK